MRFEAVLLAPEWSQAKITLARAQLNFGELDLAVQTFDTCLGDIDKASDLYSTIMTELDFAKQW
jgi:hypothetical protein